MQAGQGIRSGVGPKAAIAVMVLLLGLAALVMGKGNVPAYIAGGFTALYHQVGPVLFGLLPLSVYFVAVFVLSLLERVDLYSFRTSPVYHFNICTEMGPILGLMGTLISLTASMMALDISGGIQATITALTASIGQALNSSIYGLGLALFSYIASRFPHQKWRRVEH